MKWPGRKDASLIMLDVRHFGAVGVIAVAALLEIFARPNAQNPDALQYTFVRGRPAATAKADPGAGPPVDFPFGTATPSAFCGQCHGMIYLEHAFGFGADLKFKPIVYRSLEETPLALPADFSDNATAHHIAGVDPWPILARGVENGGQSCNVCHFPQAFDLPDINTPTIPKPVPRPSDLEAGGITCASCHLTPEGKIRGSYDVVAPHQNVVDPRIRTSAMCAYCHAAGKRIIGKQTQTFYEWRDDFYKSGLGQQHCQDCHMPRTVRSLAEGFNVPFRVVGRHVWTGDHSVSRIGQGLNLTVIPFNVYPPDPEFDVTDLELHVINIGAGHSVPTGSNRRAVYLKADIIDKNDSIVASREWMFAPWYGDRPDDQAFLEEDRKGPDAVAALQADAQGPHESPIRAGEDRVLSWELKLMPSKYTVRASLVYDLNRYNDRAFTDDQTEIYRTSRFIQVP